MASNSELDKTQTKMEAQSTETSFPSFLSVCGVCKENFQSKDPKLLPCLHTFCKACLIMEAGEQITVRCPSCKHECQITELVDNFFHQDSSTSASNEDGDSEKTEDNKTCTGCDDNATATSYCVDCTEWLCDDCVHAHRRVRVTKDHTVKPKDSLQELSDSSATNSPRLYYCPIHKHEQIKLYCETCDQLTCRDCQLSDHKDHKYQFMHEAATQYKLFLQNLLGKLQEKRTYIDNAKTLINRRYNEITEKEKAVTNDIKLFAIKLINEVNKRGKKLLTDLNAVCGAKKRQLGQKHTEILSLSGDLNHALKFAQYVVNNDSDSAILTSKKMLVNQLRHVLRTRCEVPNPYHVVDIRLQFDEQQIVQQLSRQGGLVVDGITYAGPNQKVGAPPASNSQGPRPNTRPVMTPQSGSYNNQQQMLGSGRPPNLQDLSPEQRMMLFKRLQQQMAQKNSNGSSSPNHPQGMINIQPVSSGSSQRLSHYGPASQCSMVSSTNTQQAVLKQQGGVYYPVNRQPTQPPLINLAQLQQQRHHRTHPPPPNVHSPIVIEPTSPSPPHPSSSHNTGPVFGRNSPYSRQSSTDSNSHPSSSVGPRVKQEERSSCSFGGQMVRQEKGHSTNRSHNNSPSLGMLMAENMNFDADPESYIDALRKEAAQITDRPSAILGDRDISEDYLSLLSSTSSMTSPSSTAPKDTAESGKTLNPAPAQDDESEDYCACCHNGGDLLCCDKCPKVFHLECHVPSLGNAPRSLYSGVWQCGLCVADEKLRLATADPRPEDITHMTTKRKAPVGLSDNERKVLERVLLEVFCHEASVPFHEPVPKSVPNYYKVILNPMDLLTVKSKLTKHHFNSYQTIEEFVADVKLVFSNCAQYNNPTSEVGIAGQIVEKFFEDQMTRFLPYYNTRCVSPSGSDRSVHSSGSRSKRSKKSEDDPNHEKGKSKTHPQKNPTVDLGIPVSVQSLPVPVINIEPLPTFDISPEGETAMEVSSGTQEVEKATSERDELESQEETRNEAMSVQEEETSQIEDVSGKETETVNTENDNNESVEQPPLDKE